MVWAMPVTLDEVARRAGVSSATVSRVLSETASRVPISAATRERVRAAARELDYRTNLTARSLAQGATRMIGVVLPQDAATLRSTYNAVIVAGISGVLSARGYGLALYFSEYGHSRQGPSHAALLQDGRVDGGLIVDSYALTDDQVAELEREAERFPFVLIGHRLPKSRLHWLAADDRGGAAAAVEHLYALGHRRIAHLWNRHGRPTTERYLGFQQALAAHALELPPAWVVAADDAMTPRRREVSVVRLLLDRVRQGMKPVWAATATDAPTAVFAWNDYAALAVMQFLQDAGLCVPQDVSIIGFNDFDVAQLAYPPLTTVREPMYELGALAAGLLLEGLPESTRPIQRVLPTELVVRKSTAAARS